MATGVASTTLEYFITKEFGTEAAYQQRLLVADKPFWLDKWAVFERRLRQAAGLDGESENTGAAKRMRGVRLSDKHSPKAAAAFLQEYIAARSECLQLRLLDDSEPLMVVKELEEFKEKIEDSDMLKFLNGLPDFPVAMESEEPEVSFETLEHRRDIT